MRPEERLIVALDSQTADEALDIVRATAELVSFFKVGLTLNLSAGPDLVRSLVGDGNRVFLDLKLHDIPAQVGGAAAAAAGLGVALLTVHPYEDAVAAAAAAVAGSEMKLLAVTALTSISESDLRADGVELPLQELVNSRARRSMAAGAHGVVTSGAEAAKLRELLGPEALIVTPGIRRPGDDRGDQQRTAAPADAVRAGADYLVVGRPITGAPDPRAAAAEFVEEIASAT